MKLFRLIRRAASAVVKTLNRGIAGLAGLSLDRVLSDFSKTENRLTKIIAANDAAVDASIKHTDVLNAALEAERSFRLERYKQINRAERVRSRIRTLID